MTFVKPLVPDAGASDPSGFFVQAGGTGPALFVSVDAASLPVAPGDLVDFTVTAVSRSGLLRVATALTGFLKQSSGNPVSGLTQTISNVNFAQGTALDDFESELVSLSGSVAGAMGFAGSGYQSVALTTAGTADAGTMKLRLPNALADSEGLSTGCSVQLTSTPLWRLGSQAQPSAFSAGALTGSTCPAPALVSATPLSAISVRAAFDRPMNPLSVTATTLTVAGLNVLSVSPVSGSTSLWMVSTDPQVSGMSYTLTAATSVSDVRGTPINSAQRTAQFTGYQAPIGGLVINEVDYDNVGTDANEFVELRNIGTSAVNMTGMTLVIVNGTGSAVLDTVNLPAMSLAPGAFLVVGSATLVATLPGGVASVTLASATNNLQNDNEGLALVSAGGQVLDSLTYEQATPSGITWNGIQLTEGTTATTTLLDSNTTNVSIGRAASSADTNSNVPDFTVNSAPTPGTVNTP